MSKTVIEQAIEALNSTDSERGSEAWEREKEAMIALEKLAEQPAPDRESRAAAAINQIERKGEWITREEAIAAIKGIK